MMKRISIILFSIIFLISFNAYPKKPPKKFLKDDYIFKGSQNIKWPYKTGLWGKIDTHGRIHPNPWALRYDNTITDEYALRFEVRQGDCGSDDCDRTSKKFIGRSEIGFFNPLPNNDTEGHIGEYWYKWSFYIDPESDVPTGDSFIHIGQFKSHLEHEKRTRSLLTNTTIDEFNETCPEINLLFSWRNTGIQAYRQGVTNCSGSGIKTIINQKDVKGKWHNFLLNINWTDQSDGKIKLWLNKNLVYKLEGKTISKIIRKNSNNFKLGPTFRVGVYSQGENGDQIMYYEGFRAEKNCKKFKEFNCNDLESQQITQTVIGSDTSGGWMNSETNEDQGKRERIIKTLITKITKGISKDTSANTNDIKNWVTLQIEPLDWDKDLDRAVDRKNLRNKLTEQGINKFK